jgi:hypothetical protein
MPRLPVDGKKVIEHRFSMGQFERDQLDTLITGITVKNVATPTVALLSDVSALLALTAIAEAIGLIDLGALAKKGAGAGQAWIDSVLAGVYNSIGEAIQAGSEMIEDAIPGAEDIPGYETVQDALSLGDKLWVTAQMLMTLPGRRLEELF